MIEQLSSWKLLIYDLFAHGSASGALYIYRGPYSRERSVIHFSLFLADRKGFTTHYTAPSRSKNSWIRWFIVVNKYKTVSCFKKSCFPKFGPIYLYLRCSLKEKNTCLNYIRYWFLVRYRKRWNFRLSILFSKNLRLKNS